MGTFNANILPATTGLNLGSSVQQWNGQFANLTVTGSATLPGVGLVAVTFASSLSFNGALGNVFEVTLTGNVTSSSITGFIAGVEYTFIIIQDSTGGRTFVWPASAKGTMVVDTTASKTNVQEFVYDGTSLFAVTAGVSM